MSDPTSSSSLLMDSTLALVRRQRPLLLMSSFHPTSLWKQPWLYLYSFLQFFITSSWSCCFHKSLNTSVTSPPEQPALYLHICRVCSPGLSESPGETVRCLMYRCRCIFPMLRSTDCSWALTQLQVRENEMLTVAVQREQTASATYRKLVTNRFVQPTVTSHSARFKVIAGNKRHLGAELGDKIGVLSFGYFSSIWIHPTAVRNVQQQVSVPSVCLRSLCCCLSSAVYGGRIVLTWTVNSSSL